MSHNSSDSKESDSSAINLYRREMRKRTSLSHQRIGEFITRMSVDKACKHLDLLVGDVSRYGYSSSRVARYAAEEEFMWVTNGDLEETVEMILGSELVGDADPEALRRETYRTFQDTGKSVFKDPETWFSHRKRKRDD